MTELATELHSLLVALEHELRASGSLSFATCEVLRADDPRVQGLQACLAFLHVPMFTSGIHAAPIAQPHRVQVSRLLLISLGAHTPTPRWSGFLLEQMVEAAMSMPGADLGDLVHALYELLVETEQVSYGQASFIRELADVIHSLRRWRPCSTLDSIALRLDDPRFAATEAQAFLAAQVLSPSLLSHARDGILRAVHSPALRDELSCMFETVVP